MGCERAGIAEIGFTLVYVSIRLLPKALREPVALGYLLARTSDTIADGTAVDVEKRIELLGPVCPRDCWKGPGDRGRSQPQLCGSPGMTDGENALLGSGRRNFAVTAKSFAEISVISVSCLQSSHVGNGRI